MKPGSWQALVTPIEQIIDLERFGAALLITSECSLPQNKLRKRRDVMDAHGSEFSIKTCSVSNMRRYPSSHPTIVDSGSGFCCCHCGAVVMPVVVLVLVVVVVVVIVVAVTVVIVLIVVLVVVDVDVLFCHFCHRHTCH